MIGYEVDIAAVCRVLQNLEEVVISATTYRGFAEKVHVTQLDPITFKDKNTMVEVYRVDGLRENE